MLTSVSREEVRRPVLMIAVGRQRVGKTVFLNTGIQFFRKNGAKVEIWNADTLNASHSLSLFYDDVREPGSARPEEVKTWIEGRLMDMVEKRYDAILDAGGGETALSRLVDELPVVSTLEDEGIRVVLSHLLGPETADLDYLASFLKGSRFAPEATLLVLNEGLILSGRSPEAAFAEIKKHPAFLNAVKNGAVPVRFPRLPCMADVTDRGLTFDDAMNGVAKNGKPPLSLFNKPRVRRWWTEDVPKFFIEEVPLSWLPEMLGLREEVA
jgi:hypothetical protein